MIDCKTIVCENLKNLCDHCNILKNKLFSKFSSFADRNEFKDVIKSICDEE